MSFTIKFRMIKQSFKPQKKTLNAFSGWALQIKKTASLKCLNRHKKI
ncbi:hypothetical protein HPSA50_0831 [Helicobacter pylori SouthAfrica50]|uniref:Uncharacterized protein n=1 Tax=Helicobacter pylori SouthAfrica50 TaxID=1352357 RepID=T2SAM0_HELPX|nr:hypothetical protein HPSA50_0831 [Helicobacter pylori SouthAfrica50]